MRRPVLKMLALALIGTAVSAQAQEYPTRPITMVVPFAAGGPTDTVGRMIAQSMSTRLKQQGGFEHVCLHP